MSFREARKGIGCGSTPAFVKKGVMSLPANPLHTKICIHNSIL